MKEKSQNQKVSQKIHRAISKVHHAFMQPKKNEHGESVRKEYWTKAWTEIKKLSPSELEEFNEGVETIRSTLRRLKSKVESLRVKKLKAKAQQESLQDLNEWGEDEFLDSSAALPVFKSKPKKRSGKRWVITPPMDKPKTTTEICQAIWTVITNRAITIVDKGKNIKPSVGHDTAIEKHRLAALPKFLDDKTVTDPLTSKPIMNLYMINSEVKSTMIWLLAERAKRESTFRKLYIKFLKKEVLGKVKIFEWAKKFSSQVETILQDISDL